MKQTSRGVLLHVQKLNDPGFGRGFLMGFDLV